MNKVNKFLKNLKNLQNKFKQMKLRLKSIVVQYKKFQVQCKIRRRD